MHPSNVASKTALLIGVAGLTVIAAGASATAAITESYTKSQVIRTTTMPPPAPVQIFSAIVVNPETFAQEKSVTVRVKVSGLQLVDPMAPHRTSSQLQGHLHYQLDQGPIIATTATSLSFHRLSSGDHVITVTLADNNHQPLGPEQLLTVHIP